MKSQILQHIQDPAFLEQLFRSNPNQFHRAFEEVYPEIEEYEIAKCWKERLAFENQRFSMSWGLPGEWIFMILLAFFAGVIAKIPDFFQLDEDFFYARNLGFIVFPFLSIYFLWRHQTVWSKSLLIFGAVTGAAIFINFFPNPEGVQANQLLVLSQIHLPLFLWSLMGISYLGADPLSLTKRLSYLRFNGELIVLVAIILLSGVLLTAVTIGLFEVIDIHIQDFYMKYIVIWGLAASPIVATYISQNNPGLVQKVSPIIARIFSPLVLITLLCYLIAVIITGENPYQDRDFLIVFNVLLIGVMAIIVFSLAATNQGKKLRWNEWILWILTIVTLIINGIALSAIIFRLSSWGITPNRIAVLGGNLLIFSNLIAICIDLTKVIRNKEDVSTIEKSVASFLPFYFIWTIIVTFIFPLFF